MILPLAETVVNAQVAPGTVVVTIALDASATEIWQVLTEPANVGRWLGTLQSRLCPGESVRLDFGDGDFFDLEVIQLNPHQLAQYTWRFLGIGPLNTITWRIIPQDIGCLVTVTDSELERTAEAAQELKKGWLDFTQRLIGFLTTGQTTRYDWRREFDGSIELPSMLETTWKTLFAPKMQAQWLPLNGPSLESATNLTVADNIEPSTLQLRNLVWDSPNQVRFDLTHPGWLHPTSCYLQLTPRQRGTLLSVSHIGWESISPEIPYQLKQRKRFSLLWTIALQRARQIVM